MIASDSQPAVLKVALCDEHELFRLGLRSLLSSRDDIHIVGDVRDPKQGLDLVREQATDVRPESSK